MKYLAAYLLLIEGGNNNPTADDIKKVLAAVDIDIDQERLSKLIAEIGGKNIVELITTGSEKLATVPTGGAAAAGGAAPAAAAAGGADAPAEAAKEEEKEESDDDMGFGLFD